jgi:hypothetical protein
MKVRRLVSILLIIVVISIIIGSLAYRRTYRSEPRLTISLSEYPAYVTAPTVVLRGYVSQDARIDLTRETSTLRPVDSKDNQFEAEVQLEPGENRIRLSARRYSFEPIQGETMAVITWEPKNPPVPTLNPLPTTTNLPEVTVTGTAYPNARVKITVVPDASDVSKDPKSRPNPPAPIKPNAPKAAWENAQIRTLVENQTAAKDGSFQTKLRLSAAGPYNVSSHAYNSKGTTSDASPSLQFVYDPDWYPPSSSVRSPTPKRMIRKANIVLAHKKMTATLEVTLPQDDPAVTSFLANQITLSKFFEETFDLRINNKTYYSMELRDVVPQILIKDREVTITATAPYYVGSRDLPVLRGELTLSGNRDFPFSSPNDTLTVQTYDYRIESVGPPPTVFEKNTLTWTGSGAPRLNDFEDGKQHGSSAAQIKLQLAYNPFASPRNLLRLSQVSPYSFWAYPGSTIPSVLLVLCRVIPMLWVLWLIGESPLRNTVDAGLRNDLTSLSELLVTLSLVDAVFDVSSGLAAIYPIDPRFRLLLSSFAIYLLAVLARLLASKASNRVWATWLTKISRGTADAAALVCIWLALTGILNRNQFVIRIGNSTIFSAMLAIFFFRTAKVLRHAGLNRKHSRWLTVLAGIVVLPFLLPLARLIFSVGGPLIIFQSFSMLHPLLSYALAIGLLVVLKRVNTLDQRRTRHLVLSIGLILFSGYLVGIMPNLFMIPIPFILSIWMFKKFLVHDFEKCSDLDFVNNEVVNDRRRLIGEVLAYETAQHFQANIEKLKDKVTSGDMALKEFEDRKGEIEQYAHDRELASTHINGLHAKTTVLSIGPNTDDWMNGKWCLKWAAVLIAFFLVPYLLVLLRTQGLSESYGFMFSINRALFFIEDWLLAALFFGYYFRYIRGNSGLEKGLRTACAVIICLLPAWVRDVSSSSDLVLVFFRAGQTFLFFTLLGMGAFDYVTFRNALRDRFRWRTFARFGNMPAFTAVVSVLITSIGVGLTSVLTGQFTELVTNLLNAAFQQAPGPLP